MQRVAIMSGCRTPFCKMGTAFQKTSAVELGRWATTELLAQTPLKVELIEEVIFGNVCQPADAANVSRVIALLAGIPETTPAVTVHRNCASGMESVIQAAIKIQAQQGQCYLAGGTESMSQVPFLMNDHFKEFLTNLQRAKTPIQKLKTLFSFRMAFLAPRIGLQLGLTDPVCGLNMGQTAEVLAQDLGITRHDQDEFALFSHQKAVAAREKLHEEIVPVVPAADYKTVVQDDVGPRDQQTMEALAKLKPVFDRQAGSVTAGNASQITDGAVALLIGSEEFVGSQKVDVLGWLHGWAVTGLDPKRMGNGPAHAIPQLLKKCGKTMADIALFEINEAFAAQVISCVRLLKDEKFAQQYGYEGHTGVIAYDRLNVNGGAIALGHPVGATGGRLVLTMLKELRRRNERFGVVSLCVGGGQGVALLLENPNVS